MDNKIGLTRLFVGQSSEHFTFICDDVIVEKIKAIASHEGFAIRHVMELFINSWY